MFEVLNLNFSGFQEDFHLQDNNRIENENGIETAVQNGAKIERKITKEALFSSREQKRAECVKKCRGIAEELSKRQESISSMDYLLADKV